MASQLVASKLVFLADLPTTGPGDKIRFLGCVESYDIATGILILRHQYGQSKHVAKVSIEHVRESMTTSATSTGTWLNIVGYVLQHQGPETAVQATMIWEAGSLKLIDYERSLQARKDSAMSSN